MGNEKVDVKELASKFNAEELKVLGTADTAEALKASASEMGKALTDDESNALFSAFADLSKSGELSDEALETVAGGYFVDFNPGKKGHSMIKLL